MKRAAGKPKYELVNEMPDSYEQRAFMYRAIVALEKAPRGRVLKITLDGLDGNNMIKRAHVYAERRGFRVSCKVIAGVLYLSKRNPGQCKEHPDLEATHLLNGDRLCCPCYQQRRAARARPAFLCAACAQGDCLRCDGGDCRCTCSLDLDRKHPQRIA